MKPKNIFNCLLSIIFILILYSCAPSKPEIDTSEFILAPDHTIELIAHEPTVILPVAMVEDKRNRLWVVEMPGYMRDIDGNGEDIPDGRIVILSNPDKRGKMQDRSVFLGGLLNPRAICLVYDGLLFTDGTQLKWTQIQNDKPGNTVVVDSFYVVGGNIEHQPNGLIYNIDNWIYSAKSNARYRLMNGKWIKEATTFRGQWGMTMNENGNLIYNHNSAPLLGDIVLPNQNLENPYLSLKHSTGQLLTEDMQIYPIQATSVNRGYLPEVLDSTGKLINYTSACGPHIYYGNTLSPNYYGSAFVCAPEANLIANYSYNPETHTAEHHYEENEFLVSKDESFRPVNLHTGYDGSLYIVDMRKGIIQHSAYMSSYLRDNITTKGLDKINGKGRIFRIRSKRNLPQLKNLAHLNSAEIINLLEHPDFQIRMFAQKSIIAKKDKLMDQLLSDFVKASNNPNVIIHGLWTLEGKNKLSPGLILEIAKNNINEQSMYHLLAISKTMDESDNEYGELYETAFNLNSKKVDFILASIVGSARKHQDLWFKIAARYIDDLQIAESLVSSTKGHEEYYNSIIGNTNNEALKRILEETISNKKAKSIQSPQIIAKPFDDDRTNGFNKFKRYCSACHNLDGRGQKNIAPSLKESPIIQGQETKIASIILNGYSSEDSQYQIPMPAYKEDKNMTDQDIYDIISYLKSTYTEGWNSIKLEEISSLRETSEEYEK